MEKTRTAAALIVKRTLPYAPDPLFRAFSDAAIMTRWFFTGAGWSSDVRNDFRVGGDFRIVMNSDKGDSVPHTGTYREIVPGRKLAFTWNSPFAVDSLVTITFAAAGAGTELTLVHEFLADDQRDNHKWGWTECLDQLERTFKSGL